jgi:hypothetical protein
MALAEKGYIERHIRYITIIGKMTHAAFDRNTLPSRGGACSPNTSSNSMIETLVSITDAQTILTKRIQFLPFA